MQRIARTQGVAMKCPKCQSDFEVVHLRDVEFDRCTQCRGLWFDMLDKEDLLKIKGSEVIDIGDEQVGETYNQIRDADCPKCGERMISMVDKDQFHIQYESCPSCYGSFFDAGEFRDLKEHTVVERFRQMAATFRTNLKQS
jgi:Zn-finger nucleic acid-binding protein